MAGIFNINDLIYKMNSVVKKENNDNGSDSEYKEILDKIRKLISENHSSELINVMFSEEAREKLKNLIVRYINQYKYLLYKPRYVLPIRQAQETEAQAPRIQDMQPQRVPLRDLQPQAEYYLHKPRTSQN